MKKILFLGLVIALFAIENNASAQIKVANGGNVGIGASSNLFNKLYVEGSSRFKGPTNFQPTESVALEMAVGYMYGSVPIPAFRPCCGAGYLGGPDFQNRFQVLYVNEVNYTSLYNNSDRRIKENIELLNPNTSRVALKQTNLANEETKTINKLNSINIYRYDLSKKLYDSISIPEIRNGMIEAGKNQIGVMAQELKEIFPELVKQDPTTEIYAVNYVGLIPHLILALQEQTQIAAKQSEEIENLKSQITFMQWNCCNSFIIDPTPIKDISTKSASQTTETKNAAFNNIAARLDQNVPNPFTENTKISFFVPEQTQKAQLCVYNLTGSQLKQYAILERGETSITIQGQELQAGIYLYALLVDGQLVDSKKMVLTK